MGFFFFFNGAKVTYYTFETWTLGICRLPSAFNRQTLKVSEVTIKQQWFLHIHLIPSVNLNLAGVVLCKEMCCVGPMRPSWSPWWRLKKVQLTLSGVQRASICTRVSHRTLLPSKPSWLRSTFSHTAVWLRLPPSAPVRIPLGIDKCAHIALWLTVSFVFMRLPG